jgi:hypothetical protein
LRQLVDAVPSGIDDESLLRLPTWWEIVQTARKARGLLADSMGA